MKVLAVADRVSELVYGPGIRTHFGDVDLVISCGDLPYEYLEYIVTLLAVPLLFVHGNHDPAWRESEAGVEPASPGGCIDLHGRGVAHKGLLVAGLEGSPRYKPGPYQYSERGMAWQARRLWPRLLLNRVRYGRYLDVLVTHAPPFGIHDAGDPCHVGFRSLLRFLDRFRPRYLMHGHVHLCGCGAPWRTEYRETCVINVYGYRELEIDVPGTGKGA